jgi:hypothetical protein
MQQRGQGALHVLEVGRNKELLSKQTFSKQSLQKKMAGKPLYLRSGEEQGDALHVNFQ